MFCNPYGFKHGLLPETPSSLYSRKCVYNTQCQDAFDGSRYDAQYESLCIVFIPRLYVECERRYGDQRKTRVESAEEGSQPKRVKTVDQLWPRFIAAANRSTSSTVLHASTPSRQNQS